MYKSRDMCPNCGANSLHYTVPRNWKVLREYPGKFVCLTCGEEFTKLIKQPEKI